MTAAASNIAELASAVSNTRPVSARDSRVTLARGVGSARPLRSVCEATSAKPAWGPVGAIPSHGRCHGTLEFALGPAALMNLRIRIPRSQIRERRSWPGSGARVQPRNFRSHLDVRKALDALRVP